MSFPTKPYAASFLPKASMLTAFSFVLLIGLPTQAQQSPASDGEGAAADRFAIPEDAKTAEQLFDFVQEVADTDPEGEGEQAMIAHHRKIAQTVVAVADKVLASDPSDEEAMQGYSFKLQAWRILQELGVPQADKSFAETVVQARADSRPGVVAIGIKFFVEAGFSKWAALSDQDKSSLIDAIIEYVRKTEVGPQQVQLALTVVDFLGNEQEDELAKRLLGGLMPSFRASDDPEVQGLLSMLEGILRRINLPGQKMELSGTLLDGSELDWSSYRGKVVLVDFWATWCGPCRTEVPNILKMHRAYHEKGFDVLGISLDESAEQAQSYIEQADIPWATMFSQNENERGWQHPMATYYGVTGIPRAILVDRDGTVVSMNARGKELGRLLRKILGEPIARSQPIEDGLVRQVSDSTSRE